MTTLRGLGRVLRDLVWLTIVQPVRDGRLRTAGWPVGLRAIVFSSLAVYAVVALAVIFAGPLRAADTLLVTTSGATIPELGALLCIGASALALTLFQTAALHLPWWVRLASVLVTLPVIVFFVFGALTEPVMLIPAALGILLILVMLVVRWRARYAWWEFVVIGAALGSALFLPTLLSGRVRSVELDWRATALAGALQTLTTLALPALLVAGAALAQIAVTASFAGVAAGVRELRPPLLRVLAVALAGWAAVELVDRLRDPESTAGGWLSSGIQLIAIMLLAGIAMVIARRPPAWADLDEDSTRVNYLVVLGCVSYQLVAPVLSILHEVARSLGPQWLFAFTDGYLLLTRSDWMLSAMRALVAGIGLVFAVRVARQGRPWTAMFLSGILVLALFDLLRAVDPGLLAVESVPLFAALLLVALLLLTLALGITRRLTAQRSIALACGVLLCLVYPHRAILDDPISAALGFAGIGAVLFGLVWRVLTEGDITRDETPRWPVPARVLLYCASALMAVNSAAYVALTRGSGENSLDIEQYADAGDSLLGTPLFLTAAIGCLAIALMPPRPAAG